NYKVPPCYDGRSNWFAYEDEIDDRCDITELDNDKRGPALHNRLEANVFLYRFQQLMNLHHGNGDMLRWITSFQLSVQRMQEAWNDTYLPIADPTTAEGPACADHSNYWTAKLVALIFASLSFVSLSDLTQDQRQVLTSLMAHTSRVLADWLFLNELREVYLEIFCATKSSVDNPLLAPWPEDISGDRRRLSGQSRGLLGR
ncbi:unnamed protein product, partial [Symbiodinium sp. KB8]